MPTDQGFSTDDSTRSHSHLGLVIQNEFAVCQALTKALDALVEAANAAVLLGIKEAVAILARQLGLVHGLIGLTNQLVSLDLLCLREVGDSHTC